jgi:hypothetical protein
MPASTERVDGSAASNVACVAQRRTSRKIAMSRELSVSSFVPTLAEMSEKGRDGRRRLQWGAALSLGFCW